MYGKLLDSIGFVKDFDPDVAAMMDRELLRQQNGLELIASENFAELGVPIKDMKLKKNLLLACIIRQGKIIYPHGGDTIETGDSVIVVTTSDEALDDLSDILE